MKRRLTRMVSEQEKTISDMLEVLGISPNSKYILELTGKKDFDDLKETDVENHLIQLEETINEENNANNTDRIKELERILEEKNNKVELTKNKIAEYLEQAREYEMKFEENDKEKEELLKGFQAPSTPISNQSDSLSMQLSELGRSSMVQPDLHSILCSKLEKIDELKSKIRHIKANISSIEDDIEILKPNVE